MIARRCCLLFAERPGCCRTRVGTEMSDLLKFLLAWSCVSVITPVALSKEPSQLFLQKLRERGYFDMAEIYLERMSSSPLAGPELQESLLYEQAINIVEQATEQLDAQKRLTALARSRAMLGEFVQSNPDHPAIEDAQTWLRRIMLAQARDLAALAAQESAGRRQDELNQLAAENFTTAEQAFLERIQELKAQVEDLRQQPKTVQNSVRRDALRDEYLQIRLAAATILYEKAATLRAQPAKFRQQLLAAADVFKEMAEKYRTRLVGLQCVIKQGRCYQELGDYQKALSFYEEFLQPSEQPELRALSALAALYTIECLTSEEQFDRAIEVGEQWLDAAATGSDQLAIQDVQLALARTLIQKSQQPDVRESKRFLVMARKQVLPISKRVGPRQRAARELLAVLPGGSEALSIDDVRSFADARLAGEEAQAAARAAEVTMGVIGPKAQTTENPTRRAELEQELAQARESLARGQQQAIELYRIALRLANSETLPEDIHQVQYTLCFLFYEQQRFFDAAVLGDFFSAAVVPVRQWHGMPVMLPWLPISNSTVTAIWQLPRPLSGNCWPSPTLSLPPGQDMTKPKMRC